METYGVNISTQQTNKAPDQKKNLSVATAEPSTPMGFSEVDTDCSTPLKDMDTQCTSPAKLDDIKKDAPTQFFKTPADLRKGIDEGSIKIDHTGGQTPGYAQCNMAILPKKYAFDFLMFCQRNPKSCPLIEVLDPGQYQYGDIDIRKHVHSYRYYDGT